MKTEQNNLDQLKGKNPFTVPSGYMEGLTASIMSQLPEKSREEEVMKISFMERARPWLYMAAVFAGMGLFFKVLVGSDVRKEDGLNHLIVKTEVSPDVVLVGQVSEDEEYLDYLENQYVGNILAEEIDKFE